MYLLPNQHSYKLETQHYSWIKHKFYNLGQNSHYNEASAVLSVGTTKSKLLHNPHLLPNECLRACHGNMLRCLEMC